MATQLKQVPPPGTPAWFVEMVGESASGPMMKVVDLSPSLAKFILDVNVANRDVRQTKVTQYASDMAGGKWALNGEPLIISSDGMLNDGQHRCLAVVDSNTTVPVVMVFGMDRDTRLTVDQGGARSAGDFLGMEGIHNPKQAAAIARLVLAFERNDGKSLSNSSFITSSDIRDRVAVDPAIGEAATFGMTNYTYCRKFAGASLIGFSYYVLSRVHQAEARAFLERVARGDGLKVRDPAHTLREKLIAEGRSRDRKVAMILKAWNFHRRGMKVAINTLNGTLPFPALL